MAKVTARDAAILAGGRDISGRTNTVTLTLSAEAPESTCFGNIMKERLSGGLLDYELAFGGFHDQSACQVAEGFDVLHGSSDWWGYYPNGATACKAGYEMVGIMTDHSVDNSVEGAAIFSGTVAGSAFLARTTSLGDSTVSGTASTALGSVDFAATQTGTNWHFFRLFTLTGTNPAINASLQSASADDEAEFATETTFGIATLGASSACQVWGASDTGTKRYRRVALCASGTSPCATFMCSSGSTRS